MVGEVLQSRTNGACAVRCAGRRFSSRASTSSRRWRIDAFTCALAFGVLACSSSQSGPGGADAQGGAASASGGASAGRTGTGNPSGQAGRASDGGAPGAEGGGTGTTSGNPSANCSPWPLGKLFPFVGPFFYGPDPGPCQTNDGTYTFSYADGHVQSDTDNTHHLTETFTWQTDRLLASSVSDSLDSYTYSPGSVVIVTTQAGATPMTQTYRLNSAGYPLDVSVDTGAGAQRWFKYGYVGCLLDRRFETDATGHELSPQNEEVRYIYDAQGHVLARNKALYDYGCWQGGAGGAGGIDSTVGCPSWPEKKLAPFVGSLFYGPDPGPCSWTDGNTARTFAYAGGLLQSITNSDGGSVTLTWDGEHLVSSTETTSAGVSVTTLYSYANDSLTLTTIRGTYTAVTSYHLSPTGYPLSREYVYFVTENPSTISPLQTTTYQYDNCRLSGSMYSYDAAGHLLGLFPANGTNLIPYPAGTLDYSCWEH